MEQEGNKKSKKYTSVDKKGLFFFASVIRSCGSPLPPTPANCLLISRLAVAHSRSHLRCLQVSSSSLPALVISTLIQLNYEDHFHCQIQGRGRLLTYCYELWCWKEGTSYRRFVTEYSEEDVEETMVCIYTATLTTKKNGRQSSTRTVCHPKGYLS